jgi:hypothetical protein
MVNASNVPTSINAIDPMNGQSQFPATSIIQPPTTGLRIAANAEPLFMIPLAVPETLDRVHMTHKHQQRDDSSYEAHDAINRLWNDAPGEP